MKFSTTVGAILTFVAISANQALAQQSPCEAKCSPEDMICRAKCFNVPAPSEKDINATQECVAKCVDPATAAQCFQACIGANWGELLPSEAPVESSAKPSPTASSAASKSNDAKPSVSGTPAGSASGVKPSATTIASQTPVASASGSSGVATPSGSSGVASASGSVANPSPSQASSIPASSKPSTPASTPTNSAQSIVFNTGLLSVVGVIALALI
ncbi:hypothetical protein K7432_011886 [Basidiobolus ranarum]|uniref:Uncharacterized protein n=1 Tax=Basidiobolus ranarum TaxID=34480 RepID=A0ABR2VTA7_9FUNG